MSERSSSAVGFGSAGAVAAIGVGGLLVPARDVIGNTNVALVLVVVIVATATFGGRLAGAMTAGAACLSFNFFHSQPLYTLRVRSADDIWTIILLFVIGLVVGQLAQYSRANQTRAVVDRAGAVHLEKVGALVAQDEPPGTVWNAVQEALLDELRLAGATFEPGDHPEDAMVVLERGGQFDKKEMFWSREGMELPRDGVALPVRAGTRAFGRIVLAPTPGRGTTREQRRVAVALVDLFAVTLDRHPLSSDDFVK
jgi:K+-sensing histidine kinase KdpD